jgi:hypothetical protein
MANDELKRTLNLLAKIIITILFIASIVFACNVKIAWISIPFMAMSVVYVFCNRPAFAISIVLISIGMILERYKKETLAVDMFNLAIAIIVLNSIVRVILAIRKRKRELKENKVEVESESNGAVDTLKSKD